MAKRTERDLAGLIAAASSGDTRAYEDVVLRFQRMAVAYAFGVLGDFHLAEDAAQEAFVEAYVKLATLKAPEAFAPWLRRIVYKRCDRETRRKRPDSADALGAVEPPDLNDPAHAALRAETRGLVAAALGSLTQRERAVVTMFYMESRSQEEIADFLGTTAAAVKARLHSARGRLKERLAKMAGEEIHKRAPGNAFAKRVTSAIRAFTARGPAQSEIGSRWHKRVLGKIDELVGMGDDGLAVAVELSRAPQASAREKAALHFGLALDPRGGEHLQRLMADPNAAVRRRALKSYALLISPVGDDGRRFEAENLFSRRAKSVPNGVDKLATLLDDPDVKNRWYSVLTLAPYALLGDPMVMDALARALHDKSHKVRHAAANALEINCPDCGEITPAPKV